MGVTVADEVAREDGGKGECRDFAGERNSAGGDRAGRGVPCRAATGHIWGGQIGLCRAVSVHHAAQLLHPDAGT